MNTTARSEVIDLSIIIDTETLRITGELVLDRRMEGWQRAAERIAPRTFEIILCTDKPVAANVSLPPGWRTCVAPGGYYAGKTAGGRMALGKYISWSDIDCRPEPDYFVNLLDHFEQTNCDILGGRTFYDGADFATRVNTAIAWGYLHGVDRLGPDHPYAAHNMACRRAAAGDFFGPYTGRYGGDEHFTSTFRQRKDPLLIFQDLVIQHESPAVSLRALLDRHLSEIGRLAFMRSADGSITTKLALRQARFNARARWFTFRRHSAKFAFGKMDLLRARALLSWYGWLDSIAVVVRAIIPGAGARWSRYQFGDARAIKPVTAF